jgi:hypothetical protein
MKPSHFTTPRTRAECTWDDHSAPIERSKGRRINGWRLLALALAAILAGLFLTDTDEPTKPIETKTRWVES